MLTNEPNTLLRGGPYHGAVEPRRLYFVHEGETALTLDLGNCYDHFQATAERVRHEGRELRVFAWTYRTYVAE